MLKKIPLLVLCLSGLMAPAGAQTADSTARVGTISGAAGVTHIGISLIPSFSLEQPAAIFNLALTRGRFSFEPEFTFSWEGKPWYALFWFRYRLPQAGRFRMGVGTHLGLNHISATWPGNRNPSDVILTERYLVGELSPSYALSERVSLGAYMLFARGFNVGTDQLTQFITLNSVISDIPLSGKYRLTVVPQVYYLKLYGDRGFYATSSFTVRRRGSPLSLSSLINKVIQTDIAGSKDFLWNLTLTYSFGRGEVVRTFPSPAVPAE
ncbi:hypothetical protein [Neolewinella litorea]|uniref:Outer membrane protein beta-barrel domain-containing protein n=1 Tax=Neolewinella litorea TaxID=2562452 RepID=A0A4S4NAN9_9BACT|nr:hypothetical protein [Neolewinella litorea]THH36329.1 hypothetical protein E4021_15585 [Neolewinella litorea]